MLRGSSSRLLLSLVASWVVVVGLLGPRDVADCLSQTRRVDQIFLALGGCSLHTTLFVARRCRSHFPVICGSLIFFSLGTQLVQGLSGMTCFYRIYLIPIVVSLMAWSLGTLPKPTRRQVFLCALLVVLCTLAIELASIPQGYLVPLAAVLTGISASSESQKVIHLRFATIVFSVIAMNFSVMQPDGACGAPPQSEYWRLAVRAVAPVLVAVLLHSWLSRQWKPSQPPVSN